MSFLGDLVNSIGTNRGPGLPKPALPPPRPPTTASTALLNPPPKPNVSSITFAPPVAGFKRKLDERETKTVQQPEKSVKPNPAPGLTSKISQKPVIPISNGAKPPLSKTQGTSTSTIKLSVPAISSNASPSTPPTSSSNNVKPAIRGSYAEMMARAKEAQQTRTNNPLGTIKHQATSREKISKLAERRRQDHEKLKAEKEKEKKSEKLGLSNKSDKKRGVSPVKSKDQARPPRAPRPPLHAPSSSYKGTMGTAAKKPHQDRVQRRNRNDEYLGTDEEDNSEMDDDGDDEDGYGYGSDGSSDMEAGLDDIDMEESLALRAAKADDAKELAYEGQLKREKEERRRRLQAMAKKGR